ncbi:Cleavage and polyadenylation specificity factor 73, partial [Dictyocoela roeselum]
TGYCVNGTLAKEILSEPKEVDGKKLNMSVEYISFSAHVDFIQNSEFIEICNPTHLFLVHGEGNEMQRLKLAIASKIPQIQIHTLRNCEEKTIEIDHKAPAILIGEKSDQFVVIKDEDTKIFNIENLEHSGLKKVSFKQKVVVHHDAPIGMIRNILIDFFQEDLDEDLQGNKIKENNLKDEEDFKKEINNGLNDLKENDKPLNDLKEIDKGLNDLKEIDKGLNDLKENNEVPNDLKEINNGLNDLKEIIKDPNDLKENDNSLNDLKEIDKGLNDLKEINKGLNDLKEINKGPNDLKENNEVPNDLKENDNSLNDFKEI